MIKIWSETGDVICSVPVHWLDSFQCGTEIKLFVSSLGATPTTHVWHKERIEDIWQFLLCIRVCIKSTMSYELKYWVINKPSNPRAYK